MLVHKGGQINNVQLITGVRIAEMSQLQNCSVMCTKNGSYGENEKRERKSQGEGDVFKEWKLCEKEKVRGAGQGRCERRSEAFVQNPNFFFFFFFFFFFGGGGGVGQVGCEGRSEAFVKI